MIGYMGLVTLLVLVFGGISLLYLWRTVGTTIEGDRELAAVKAKNEGRMSELQAARGAGRTASHADAGPRADQGVAVVPRLARHAARHGDRRRRGASR